MGMGRGWLSVTGVSSRTFSAGPIHKLYFTSAGRKKLMIHCERNDEKFFKRKTDLSINPVGIRRPLTFLLSEISLVC